MFKASEGEDVVGYFESLATQKIGCDRISQRVNKIKLKSDRIQFLYIGNEYFILFTWG